MNHHHQQRPYSANAACAACKHQRKKCDERCLLSPYFPANKCREFQAVHGVFGVSNATKMMLAVSEADRDRLMESLVREALMRKRDPVLGIYGEYQRKLDELLYFKTLAQSHVVQMQQLQSEINRIGTNNSIVNSSVPVAVTASSGLVGRNRGNNPGVNLGRSGIVSATANEGNDKMTQVLRDSESCIIDAIPYTCELHNHLQIKNKNQERDLASPAVVPLPSPPNPPGRGYKQQYYISGVHL